MTLSMRTIAGTLACLTALTTHAYAAPVATVLVDYGTTGTSFSTQTYSSVFGTAAPVNPPNENADSVDMISNTVGSFNVLLLTSGLSTPLDLSGFSADSFFEVDIEVLPQDESALINFDFEFGEGGNTSSKVNFDFAPIAGAGEIPADPGNGILGSPRVSPAAGAYTLTSTNTLGTLEVGGAGLPLLADLTNIEQVEFVYQATNTLGRDGETFAHRVSEVRIIDPNPIPEPATAAGVLLAMACFTARRRLS